MRIAGVILNRVGSPRHEEVLRQACEHAGVPVFGAIPRADELSVPSTALGLITAVEHGEQARAAVEAMTTLVSRHVDLAGIAAVATSRVNEEPWDPAVAAPADGNVTVALAAGKAFSFGYAEHGELLCAAGGGRRRVRPVDRSAADADRGRWCCPVDSPNSSAPNCRPTM